MKNVSPGKCARSEGCFKTQKKIGFTMSGYPTSTAMVSTQHPSQAKHPKVYQIDFTAVASGKRIASTKRRVRWYVLGVMLLVFHGGGMWNFARICETQL